MIEEQYPAALQGFFGSDDFINSEDDKKPLLAESFRRDFITKNEIKDDEQLKYINDSSEKELADFRKSYNIPRFIPTAEQSSVLYGQLPDLEGKSLEEKLSIIQTWRDNALPNAVKQLPGNREDLEFNIEEIANNIIRNETAKDNYKPGGMPDWLTDKTKRIGEAMIKPFYDLADYKNSQRFFAKNLVENPEFDKDIFSDFASGIGQLLTQTAISLGETMAGAPELIPYTFATLYGAQYMNEAYQDEMRKTGDETKAVDRAVNSMTAAGLDTFSDAFLLRGIGKGVGNFSERFLKAAGEAEKRAILKEAVPAVMKEMGVQALSEGLIGGAGADIASNLGNYAATGDESYLKNATDVAQLARSAFVEGTLGALFGGVFEKFGKTNNQDLSKVISGLTLQQTKADDIFEALKAKDYDKVIEITRNKLITPDQLAELNKLQPQPDQTDKTTQAGVESIASRAGPLREADLQNKKYTRFLDAQIQNLSKNPEENAELLEKFKKARALFYEEDGVTPKPYEQLSEFEVTGEAGDFLFSHPESKSKQTREDYESTLQDGTTVSGNNVIYVNAQQAELVQGLNLLQAIGEKPLIRQTQSGKHVTVENSGKVYESSLNPKKGYVPIQITDTQNGDKVSRKFKVLSPVKEFTKKTEQKATKTDVVKQNPDGTFEQEFDSNQAAEKFVQDNKDTIVNTTIVNEQGKKTVLRYRKNTENNGISQDNKNQELKSQEFDSLEEAEKFKKDNQGKWSQVGLVQNGDKYTVSYKERITDNKDITQPVEPIVEPSQEQPEEVSQEISQDTVDEVAEKLDTPAPVVKKPRKRKVQKSEVEQGDAPVQTVEPTEEPVVETTPVVEAPIIRTPTESEKLSSLRASLQYYEELMRDEKSSPEQKKSAQKEVRSLREQLKNTTETPVTNTLDNILYLGRNGQLTGTMVDESLANNKITEDDLNKIAQEKGFTFDGTIDFAKKLKMAFRQEKKNEKEKSKEKDKQLPTEEDLQKQMDQRRADQKSKLESLAQDVGLSNKKITIVNTENELPKKARDLFKTDGPVNQAMVVGDHVYFVLDNINPYANETPVEAAARIFKHEIVGHLKVSQVLSGLSKEGFKNLVTFLKTLKYKDKTGIWDERQSVYPEAKEEEIVDEIFAKIAEMRDKQSRNIIQKIVDWVRVNFLKAGKGNWTADDLEAVIRLAFDTHLEQTDNELAKKAEKAYNDIEEAIINDDKRAVMSLIKKAHKEGLVSDKTLEETVRISKDKDMSAEDLKDGGALSEIEEKFGEKVRASKSDKKIIDSIHLNASLNGHYGAWISKSGEVIPVNNQDHFGKALEILGEDNVETIDGAYRQMEQAGYLRVVHASEPFKGIHVEGRANGIQRALLDYIGINDEKNVYLNNKLIYQKPSEVLSDNNTIRFSKQDRPTNEFKFRLEDNLNFPGLTIANDGTVPLTNLDAKIRKSGALQFEVDTLTKLAKGLAKDGRINLEEFNNIIKEQPNVVVNELAVVPSMSPNENVNKLLIEKATIKHEVDTKFPGWTIYGETNMVVSPDDKEMTIKQAIEPEPYGRNMPQELVELQKRLANIENDIYKIQGTIKLESQAATGKHGVDPYSNEYLKGTETRQNGKQKAIWSGDLSLNVPLDMQTQAEKLKIEPRSPADLIKHPEPKFTSQHYDGDVAQNQLAFVRGAIHEYQEGAKLPNGSIAKGGERVYEIWELQSDWQNTEKKKLDRWSVSQKSDGTWELKSGDSIVPTKFESKDAAIKNRDLRMKAFGDDTSSPLLEYYETLALKTAVNFAARNNVTWIEISDAESVALNEGHDKIIERVRKFNGKDLGTIENGNTYLAAIRDYIKEGRVEFKKDTEGTLHGNGKFEVRNNIIHITKEPFIEGDRQSYDRNAPDILSKLTGQKPVKADMGEHGKVEFENAPVIFQREYTPEEQNENTDDVAIINRITKELEEKYPEPDFKVRVEDDVRVFDLRDRKVRSNIFNRTQNTGRMFPIEKANKDIRYSKQDTYGEDFKAWFGDWENNPQESSKVVDEKGEPLVVYHGTQNSSVFGVEVNKDFDIFYPLSHFGTAESANQRVTNHNNYEFVNGQKIYPVYLNIRNPLEMTDSGVGHMYHNFVQEVVNQGLISKEEADKFTRDHVQKLIKLGTASEDPSNNSERAAIALIRHLGYDGFKYVNNVEDKGSISWATLYPNQIKSSTGNKGTYNPNNPDIRFSKQDNPSAKYSSFFQSTPQDLTRKNKSLFKREINKLIKTAIEQKLIIGEKQVIGSFRAIDPKFLDDQSLVQMTADLNNFVNTRTRQKSPLENRTPLIELQNRLAEYEKESNANEFKHYKSIAPGVVIGKLEDYNSIGQVRALIAEASAIEAGDLENKVGFDDEDVDYSVLIEEMQYDVLERLKNDSEALNQPFVQARAEVRVTGNPILDRGANLILNRINQIEKLRNEFILHLVTTDPVDLTKKERRQLYYSLMSLTTDGYPNGIMGFVGNNITNLLKTAEFKFRVPYATKVSRMVSSLESAPAQLRRLATNDASYNALLQLVAPFRDGLFNARVYHETVVTPYLESEFQRIFGVKTLPSKELNKIGIYSHLRQHFVSEKPSEGLKKAIEWVAKSLDNANIYDKTFRDVAEYNKNILKQLTDLIEIRWENGRITNDLTDDDVRMFHDNARKVIGDKGIEYADSVVRLFDTLKPLSKLTTEYAYGREFDEIVNFVPSMSIIMKGPEESQSIDVSQYQFLTDNKAIRQGSVGYQSINTTGSSVTKDRMRSLNDNRSLIFSLNYLGDSTGRLAVYDFFTSFERRDMQRLLTPRSKEGKMLAEFLGDKEGRLGKSQTIRNALETQWQNVMSQASYMHPFHSGVNWFARKFAQSKLSSIHQIFSQTISNTIPFFVQNLANPKKTGNYIKALQFYTKFKSGRLNDPVLQNTISKILFEVRNRHQENWLDKSVNLNDRGLGVEWMKENLPKVYSAMGATDKFIENGLLGMFRVSDSLSGVPMMLAEYLSNEQERLGRPNLRFEDLVYDSRSYIKSLDEVERYLGIGDNSRRGEYLTNRNASISLARNLLISFRSFAIGNATNFMAEYRKFTDGDMATADKMKSLRYMAGIVSQSVAFSAVKVGVQLMVGQAIINALKDKDDDKEMKEMYRKSQDKMTQEQRRIIDAEISMRQKIRKALDVNKRNENDRILFINTVKDAASNMFLWTNLDFITEGIVHIGSDKFEEAAFNQIKEGETEQLKKLIKHHKSFNNNTIVANLQQKLDELQSQTFQAAAFEERGYGMLGGTFGGTAKGITDAMEAASVFFEAKAISAKDMLNIGAAMGMSQPDLFRLINTMDKIQKANDENQKTKEARLQQVNR